MQTPTLVVEPTIIRKSANNRKNWIKSSDLKYYRIEYFRHQERLSLKGANSHALKHTLVLQLGHETIDIPFELASLSQAIQSSTYLLKLGENWDDEGSEGYSVETWERAIKFLVNMSKKSLDVFGVTIDAPKIYHGPQGSIDMLWKTSRYQILANFPASADSPASFYGDNFGKDSLKGTFDVSNGGCNLLMLLVGAQRCTI